MAFFSCQYLINRLASRIGQLDNLATLLKQQCVRAIIILCHSIGAKATVADSLLADCRICYCHIFHSFRCKCIGGTIFCVKIVEHVVLGINIFSCKFQSLLVIFLVYDHVRVNTFRIFPDCHYIYTCILGPDRSPVHTSDKIRFFGIFRVVGICCDGIIADEHYSRTGSDSFDL